MTTRIPTFKVVFPFVHDMGSLPSYTVSESSMETKEENALWHLNHMRDHDGLPHLIRLPKGTVFTKIED